MARMSRAMLRCWVAVLFFGSVQLMSIGLLGEYIGRIYLETKHRPTYLVRKTYGEGP